MLIKSIIGPFSCQIVANANDKARADDEMLKLK